MKVRILRDTDGAIMGFEVRGHAGFAEAGQDIVCAGASALTQAAILGLEERLGLACRVKVERGDLACHLPRDVSPAVAARAQDIVETMVLGLRSMALAYPGHVQVIDNPPPGGVL